MISTKHNVSIAVMSLKDYGKILVKHHGMPKYLLTEVLLPRKKKRGTMRRKRRK